MNGAWTQRLLRPKDLKKKKSFIKLLASNAKLEPPGLADILQSTPALLADQPDCNPQCASSSSANDPTCGLGPMESLPFAVVAASSFVGLETRHPRPVQLHLNVLIDFNQSWLPMKR
jgi:hypothetical protein